MNGSDPLKSTRFLMRTERTIGQKCVQGNRPVGLRSKTDRNSVDQHPPSKASCFRLTATCRERAPMDFLVPSLLPQDLTVEAGASWQCVQGLEPWNEERIHCSEK